MQKEFCFLPFLWLYFICYVFYLSVVCVCGCFFCMVVVALNINVRTFFLVSTLFFFIDFILNKHYDIITSICHIQFGTITTITATKTIKSTLIQRYGTDNSIKILKLSNCCIIQFILNDGLYIRFVGYRSQTGSKSLL